MNEQVEALLRTLPRKIKVGAYDWKVSLEEGADEHCGQADFEPQIIRLWPDSLTSPAHAVGILLHECLHVIYDNEDLEDKVVHSDPEDLEEDIVVGFEQGLVSLYRDNPRLLTWIKKGLK